MRARSTFPTAAVVVLAGLALSLLACASSGARHSRAHAVREQTTHDDAAIIHFLDRITFGSRVQDVDAVRAEGATAYLDRQLHPDTIPDVELERRLASFETLALSSREIADEYYRPAQEARRRRQALGAAATPPDAVDQEVLRKERLVLQELTAQKVLRAVYSERQLQEVLVDFWFNHFNVFAGKGADRELLTAYERDAIRPRVFGRFRDLLGAVAENPAMLFYLDNWMNVDPNGPHPVAALRGRQSRAPQQRPALAPRGPRRGLNENYARELMELHTLGVDGGYSQRDVVEVARCFTGWTVRQPRDGGGFVFDERLHDPGQKVVLGHVIKAGGGRDDGDRVLDLLAHDPHTARFIAMKLARRFVSDDPPDALVDGLARRFRQTDGDLREVYRALFTSREFWSPEAIGVKAKTPFEFLASALRATDAQVNGEPAIVQTLRVLGMPPYFCQQPNGYPDRADAWMNAGALLARMNVALAIANNRLPGAQVSAAAIAGSADMLDARGKVVHIVLHDRVSDTTAASLSSAKTVPQLLALALGSPEFQKR